MVEGSTAPSISDIFMTPDEIAIARERGRSMAAQAVRCNPEKRKEMEDRFGREFCRARWPEAYKA